MTNFLFNFLSGLLVVSISLTSWAQENSAPIPTTSAQYPMQVINLSSDERIATNALLADKSKRKLTVIDQECLTNGSIKEQYTIDIGKKTGDKKKRDDRRTPEGMYVLLEKKAPPEIPFETYGSMAFTTNYPNFFDKFENKTGSGIWLHSVPDKVPLTRGSSGCVVLRNNDIKKIESSIKLNRTFLIIDSQINWISAEQHEKEKKAALAWFENWRSQWEKQDIEAYIQNYSEEFSAPPYTKKTWYEHKQKLKDRYTYVKVGASDPNIFQTKNQYIIQFVQNYESDGHKDTGIKTLHVLKEGDSLKIKREDWTELK